MLMIICARLWKTSVCQSECEGYENCVKRKITGYPQHFNRVVDNVESTT
jgi:hypothetical protein